jgi:DNA-binding NtrC family response regulator
MSVSVLIVDDEREFADSLVERVSLRGIDAFAAYSGEECLAALEEEPVDVVLVDLSMSGMDGIETLRRVRARHPLVEVIMLTGHASVATAIEGMRLGAFDYLKKPAEIEILVQKVQQAYKKRQEHQQKILEAFGKELRGRRAV